MRAVMGDLIENGLPLSGQDFQCPGQIAKCPPREQNPQTVGPAEETLRVGVLVMAARPDYQHTLLPGGGLSLVEDGQAGGHVVAVEDAGGQHDDGLNEVISQKTGADQILVFGLFVASVLFFCQQRLSAQQNALRHDDDGFAVRFQRFRDVLHPGIVAIVRRRHPISESIVRIAAGEVFEPPALQ